MRSRYVVLAPLAALLGCNNDALGTFTQRGYSPWCSVEPTMLVLNCVYFSKEHCARAETGILPVPDVAPSVADRLLGREPLKVSTYPLATCVRNPT